ncbi:unnamed protein product [Lepeophtheirus salmonis]|uniref:(salmon louse) hypothetical protein n=1 Tax=Lepeophtheirus salmonis TaxID=72036 RepID=A0A7R8CGB2_LEPSM|nr:unnamed protein product [Lepeophtheirus salmonis]CAF2814722.1 unnamed protein product [Lepeophtheirus salmonis]
MSKLLLSLNAFRHHFGPNFKLNQGDKNITQLYRTGRKWASCYKEMKQVIQMSNKHYMAFFIYLVLSMTLGESFPWSDYESGKQIDQMERIHSFEAKSEEVTVKRSGKMVLCRHNLFNALRVACSSI